MDSALKYGKQSKLEPTVHSVRPVDLSQTTKDEIKAYFTNTYALYETIFDSIKYEKAYTHIPDTLRRPIIWYLGHSAALYINKLKDIKLVEPVNEWYEKFFKTGVDPIYPEELDNEVYKEKLPKSQEVWEFRCQVYDRVLKLIDELPLTLPIKEEDPIYAIILGCEHERIHFETSTLLLRQMPLEYLEKPAQWKISSYDTQSFPQNEMVQVNEQNIRLGKNREFPTYGWDNEYGEINVNVRQFKASKFMISNGEYLEFYKSGGYEDPVNWEQEGWAWKQRSGTKQPLFWIPDEEKGFRFRTIFEEIDMPLNWPVEVSYHEAKAYCNWKGPNFRMIKESEFNVIRAEDRTRHYGENRVEADIGAFDTECGNLNVKFGGSCPVNSQKSSPLGFYDTYGNVWEWSESHFKPFPGFREHYLYHDFSGGCFDQKHNLLLGGAWSSTGLNASSYFRVAFRRHFYQNVGFRLIEEIPDDDQQEMYTDPVYLNRYLHFNFATNEEFFSVKSQSIDLLKQYECYPVKIAQECIKYFEKIKREINPNIQDIYEDTHALDLGCGMGRTAFELAKHFPRVTGLDYAHGFIDVANELKAKGEMKYTHKKTGAILEDGVAKIDDTIERERLLFIQGDAMNLPTNFGPFDLIIASNLIDRLYNPVQCLIDLCPLLTYNGCLILTSPYTWMENIADKSKWIGGKDGQTTFEALKELMATLCFELVDEQTMTLFIKEHERKFEFIMPHMTIWRKKQYSQEFATSIFKNADKY